MRLAVAGHTEQPQPGKLHQEDRKQEINTASHCHTLTRHYSSNHGAIMQAHDASRSRLRNRAASSRWEVRQVDLRKDCVDLSVRREVMKQTWFNLHYGVSQALIAEAESR